ncbi:hypothetical protein V4S28_06715 [Enterococcus cecorum]|uniref:hypothetical protein n=1 Tax=Enterococcus cecorum TaxID=44008 RepID=UPI001FAD4DE5|nr:hypothetical protein [Enterococcus cecorum]MCJ0567298.1 hypothetical protein [Enterococcus cecorum]
MILLEIDSTNEHNKFVDEWSAHGQSDINLEHQDQVVADPGTKSDIALEHKGQMVTDTRINRLIRTTHTCIGGPFFLYSNLKYKL